MIICVGGDNLQCFVKLSPSPVQTKNENKSKYSAEKRMEATAQMTTIWEHETQQGKVIN